MRTVRDAAIRQLGHRCAPALAAGFAMSRTLRVSAALAVLLLGAAAAFVLWSGARSLDTPLRLTAPARFKVAPGASFARVATELAAQGIVAQPRVWILYARWKGLAPGVKA